MKSTSVAGRGIGVEDLFASGSGDQAHTQQHRPIEPAPLEECHGGRGPLCGPTSSILPVSTYGFNQLRFLHLATTINLQFRCNVA